MRGYLESHDAYYSLHPGNPAAGDVAANLQLAETRLRIAVGARVGIKQITDAVVPVLIAAALATPKYFTSSGALHGSIIGGP